MKCIYLIMFKKKVGIIGLGSWGKNIYRNLNHFDVVELVYDNDLKNINFDLIKKDKITENINEIFLSKTVDSIIISSPAITHKDYIIKSLKNNKNVFVEKPLCLSLRDSKEIEKVANEVNKIVFTGHLLQYHNAFKKLKHNIKIGKIGKLNIIKANRLNFGAVRKIESVLYDLASHDLSMILSIIGNFPVKVDVNAVFKNSKTVADYINVILHFEKNLIAILNMDWISPYKEHRFSVFGTKGSLIFDDTRDWKNKLIFNPSYLNKKNDVVYKPNISIAVQEEEPLKKEIESFLKCVEYNDTPITNIKEAINVQVVLDMIENKLKNKYGLKNGFY